MLLPISAEAYDTQANASPIYIKIYLPCSTCDLSCHCGVCVMSVSLPNLARYKPTQKHIFHSIHDYRSLLFFAGKFTSPTATGGITLGFAASWVN